MASHDLQAPLRTIDSLAVFLQEDLGTDLPVKSARHLRLMRLRIQRLEELLRSLLEYSRVGRIECDPVLVDLTKLIQNCADLLGSDGFSVRIDDDLPLVRTHKAPLELIVRNLLDNAIKHHDRGQGEIAISGSVSDEMLTLSVQDDGPGIERRFHERVFGLFQTLRPRDSVEGSGMGLAILGKTIESAGGTIVVESNPPHRRGTCFTFTWPVRPLSGTEPIATGTRIRAAS